MTPFFLIKRQEIHQQLPKQRLPFEGVWRHWHAFILTGLMAFSSASSWAQLASYPLDSSLNDSNGVHNATSSGDLSFLSEGERNFVRLGDDAVLTLPVSLNEAVVEHDSFEIGFDFRLSAISDLTDCCRNNYPLLATETIDASENPRGFTLELIHFPGFDPEEVYLSFLPQAEESRSAVQGVLLNYNTDQKLGQWRRFSARFELARNMVLINLDGQVFLRGIGAELDVDAFKSDLAGNLIRFLGLDNFDTDTENADVYLDNLEMYAPAPPVEDDINSAFSALRSHVLGQQVLTDETVEEHAGTITNNLAVADYALVESALFAFTEAYESVMPPMYANGDGYRFEDLPPLQRVLQTAQGWVFEIRFQPDTVENMAGVSFEHHEVAPGKVAEGTPRIATAEVVLDGTYLADIAAELTDQSRVVRPTGYYLAAGDIVTVRVPQSVINQGLSVIVGHHFRNMDYDYIGAINRFPDISAEYPLDATEIRVGNPFGGGIYLKVPEGTEAGEVAMTIENAVHSPYFSWRQGKLTDVSEWLDAVSNSGAPWADFESDKFMFTVPTSELDGVVNPDEIMSVWDEIIDAFDLVGGREWERPRAEYYTFDTRLVTPAYGAGYPMVVPKREAFREDTEYSWNPLTVTSLKPNRIFLHESGHNQLHPMLSYGKNGDQCLGFEAETTVHNLALAVYPEVYGESLDDAFKYSANQELTFDQAAFDWLVTVNFRSNLPMFEEPGSPLGDSNQLHYQHRGHAKYGDIARLFGLQGLSSVNAEFYEPGVEQQARSECSSFKSVVDRDDYIRAASKALNVNMTPLFHFWGINPSDALAEELSSYPSSPAIYYLLVHYRDKVAPKTKEDFLVFANQFPVDDYQYPRYPWYLEQFDQDFADAIQSQFNFLLETYFNESDMLTIGGSVSGLSGSGLSLNLALDFGEEQLHIENNGAFTFETPVVDLSQYEVTVLNQPDNPSQACTVNNGKGSLAGANITDINVVCVELLEDIFSDGFEGAEP